MTSYDGLIRALALAICAMPGTSVIAAVAVPQGDAQTPAAEHWVVPPVLASGALLPAPPGSAIRWSASGAALHGDRLVNPGDTPIIVHLTGQQAIPNGRPVTKRFTVTLLGCQAHRVRAYTRTPTSAHDANQPIIARAVHLAMARGTDAPRPLNGDYGIVFPLGHYVGIDRVEHRGLSKPSLFHFADGSLGIIATRVDLDGRPDGSQASSALVFKSDPASPADFTELGLVDLRTTGGVSAPRAIWDSATRRYLVAWTDHAGKPQWTVVQDLARTERVATPFYPEQGGRRSRIVSGGNIGLPQAGTPIGLADDVAIDARTAAALTTRYGRITNIASRVAPQRMSAGGDLPPVRATLSYSDGSTATRAVDWDAADLARLRTKGPGTYRVHGTIRQRRYPTIFAYNRADPVIHRYTQGGRTRYLFIATDDTDNDNVGSPHLPIRVANSIAALSDEQGGRAREVDLLNRLTRRDRTVEGRVIAGCYWAPELHEIGGRLSILFAPCFNPKDDGSNVDGAWHRVASHIMQLRPGGDPADPADWSRPAAILQQDGTPLGREGFARNISLDMSYYESGGRSYYTWSQRYLTDSGPMGDPLTWTARVDPAHPTRLLSPPRPIIAPTRSFEENLSEGAFAVHHDGRIHLIYSSSGVSPTYVVGGAWARAGCDLTDIDSWHKWTAPLQHSAPMPPGVTDYRRYEQGTGHGAFNTDEDGNLLYVYHSWGDGVGGNGRDTRLRRVHWAWDGHPVLDMTEDEEVAPANRRVTMQVTIRRR